MILYIKRLGLFLVIFFVSLFALTALWGEYAPEYFEDNLNYELGSCSFLYNRVREAETTKGVDVLVLGASQAYRGFDPRIFKEKNISIFNLGSSNQSQIQTEVMVNRFLKQLKPKIVIIVVNHESFSMDGNEAAFDFLCHGQIEYNTIGMVFRLNSIRTYFTFIYSVYRKLFNRDKDFVHPTKCKYDKYINGGYVEKEYHPFWGTNLNNRIKWKARSYQKRAFERSLRKINETGAKIFIVQAPHEKKLYDKISYKDEYNNYYKSLNCEYYSYNELVDYSRDYFYDSFHLNQQGVDTFNHDLISRLQLKQLLNK